MQEAVVSLRRVAVEDGEDCFTAVCENRSLRPRLTLRLRLKLNF